MNSSNRDLDDLTMIKGIGPARQQWLKESLDVHTFGDLAALSVDEIESQLKADKQIASRENIAVWLGQANEHAEKAKRPRKPSRVAKGKKAEEVKASPGENETISPPVKSEEADDGGKAESPTKRDGWRPFASFVVEYQKHIVEGQAIEYRTTAHHMETDTGTDWPGIEREKHCYWMLEQLGDTISKEPVASEEPLVQEQAAKRASVARSPVRVEIARVRAFQPPQDGNPVWTGKPDQLFEGHLKSERPFTLEILFNLVGEAAEDLTEEQAVFRARAYVQDQSTGSSIHLGDVESGRLVKGELVYAAILPEVSLPPGMYHLFAIVTLQAVSVRPDFVTIPMFEVVR